MHRPPALGKKESPQGLSEGKDDSPERKKEGVSVKEKRAAGSPKKRRLRA